MLWTARGAACLSSGEVVTVFWRYWLLQIPGWVLLSVGVYLAHAWMGLPIGAGILVLGLWLVKDLLLYPILARHYESREPSPHVSFIGRRAVSRQVLEPSGYIELNGQLWLARPVDAEGEPAAPIAAGETVEVRGLDGLTLLVRRLG